MEGAGMKFLKQAAVITGILSFLYLAGSVILPRTQYAYRMWTDLMGQLLAGFLLPLFLLLLAGMWLWRRQKPHAAVKGILTAAAGAAYLFWGFWVFLFVIFSLQEEKRLTGHLLVVNESEFLGASRYEYYEPVLLLFRRPGELTEDIKAEYLRKKYGAYVREFGELDVQVYGTGMALEDNFTESVTAYLARKGLEEQQNRREYMVSQNHCQADSWLYLKLENEEEIRAFSEEIAELIRYMMGETAFFEDHRGVVGFYCGDGQEQISGIVPFGNLSQWDRLEEDYYRDAQLIAEKVAAEYEDSRAFREKYQECCRVGKDGELIPENTVIIDMYAVETESGRVIVSGRKSWEDPGTQEYREATGEGQ